MKQTFNIPDGCKTVSVEQVGNQIITSFEPEKYEPKVGDCVKRISEHGNIYIGEYDGDRELYHCVDVKANVIRQKMIMLVEQGSFHKITPEEFQAEFKKLGYVYDFETHTASKKRWRAEKYGEYYLLNSHINILMVKDYHCEADDIYYNLGNYFKTKEDAEMKASEIKKLLKQ